MSTTTTTPAPRSARLATAAARRRSRVADRLDGLDAANLDGATLLLLSRLAAAESRRIPTTLRQTLDADDVAQTAAVRLYSSDAGRLTLAALTSASAAARDAARRTARGVVRSVVGTAIRTGTAADVTADALTAPDQTGPLAFRTGVERDLVTAALDADGYAVRPDRDHGRTVGLDAVAHIGRGATVRAARRAGLDAAAADTVGSIGAGLAVRRAAAPGSPSGHGRGTFATIHEQSTTTAVRIIRETSLERLLTSTMRTGLPDAARGAETAGRTLSGLAADRADAAAYRHAFAVAVDAHAADRTGRGAAALADAVDRLAARDWVADAAAARHRAADALAAAQTAADAAQTAAARSAAHPGRDNAAAARTAATAALAAERVAAHAVDVWQVTTAAALDAADGRPVRLAGLAVLTLSTSADTLRTGAGRRRAATGTADRSTIGTAVLLDVLTGTRDTASNVAARLRAVLDAAAADALDGLAVRPAPSARLAADRSRSTAAVRLPGSPPPTWSTLAVWHAARLADARRLAARRDAAAADAARRTVAAIRSTLTIREPVLSDVGRTVRRLTVTLPDGSRLDA